MPIESLSISRFRNLQRTDLQVSPRLNLITGDNAAGKTSLLEALFVLGRGRSFRTTRLDRLIQSGESDFQIFARLAVDSGRIVPVGMKRVEGRLECRIDSRPAKKLSELATLFPIHWIGGNLHTLVEDGPAYRRQFLDWGLFHVKPDYMPLWKRFNQLLKQRNAVLRSGGSAREVKAWHPELAETAESVHRYRKTYLHDLLSVFSKIVPRFRTLEDTINIEYRKGWPEQSDYRNVLLETLATDQDRKFTGSGPQRAELAFRTGAKPVSEQLSRGQQKVFITALQVAQALLLHRETGKTSLFLLDDLGSELDIHNQRATLVLLAEIHAQVFVTAIEKPPIDDLSVPGTKLFHVKHGVVTEVV